MKEDIKKIVILEPTPIIYKAPLFKEISNNEGIDLIVYFGSKIGIKNYNAGFGKKIKWDIPLLEGYKYKFYKNNFILFKKIISQRPDFILLPGWDSIKNWFVCFLCLFLKTKILMRGVAPLNQELKKNKYKIKIKKYLLSNILFPTIDYFLYIGESNKNFYKFYKVSEKKLFFFPYAVDNKRFVIANQKLKNKKKMLRKKLKISKDDVVIIFVAKLIDKKRPIDLLKIFKLLITNYNLKITPHLIFIGEGKLRKEMENYIDENNLPNVHLVGFKNQTELPKYYTMADIFILPSGMGETWGAVVNEAMNFRLPIIVSKTVGSAYDLVEEGVNGFRFEEGNINEAANKINKLIKDTNKINKFGKKSFEIIKNYSYNKDVETLLKIINIK